MIAIVLALLLATPRLAEGYRLPPFNAVIGGSSNPCVHFLNCIRDGVEWRGQWNQFRETPFTVIAPARGGQFFAAANRYPPAVEIANVRSDAAPTLIFSGLPSYHAVAMTIDGGGTFHVLVVSATTVAIASIDRDGALRALHPLGAATDFEVYSSRDSIDLASDQCTLYFADAKADVIRRYDLCRGVYLPDFVAIGDGQVRTMVVLPDGGVLVPVFVPGESYKDHVRRYDARGVETARHLFPEARFFGGPLAVESDWQVLAAGANGDLGGRVYRIDLRSGTMTKAVQATSINDPYTIVPLAGWTAAIGFTGEPRRRAGH